MHFFLSLLLFFFISKSNKGFAFRFFPNSSNFGILQSDGFLNKTFKMNSAMKKKDGNSKKYSSVSSHVNAAAVDVTPVPVSSPQKKTIFSSSLPANFFENKKVLVRCDLNVPYKIHKNSKKTEADLTSSEFLSGNDVYEILDSTRIEESLKTILYLKKKNAKIILISHLGRVKKEGYDENFSLFFVKKKLEDLLEKSYIDLDNNVNQNVDDSKHKNAANNKSNDNKVNIKIIPYDENITNEETVKTINNMNAGDIVMFDNIRFYKGESKNDNELAKKLGDICDIYVNDAFGASHRKHASLHAITKFTKVNLAGFLLNNEIVHLKSLLSTSSTVPNSLSPFIAIIGGSKISTKINVIKSLMKKVNCLILGGAMVFTFFKARNINVGKSLAENEMLDVAKEIEELANINNVRLVFPIDLVIADKISSDKDTKIKVVKINEIDENFYGLDHGPQTTKLIVEILQNSRTILWNGPLGISEIDAFSAGTNEVAKAIAKLTEENKNVKSIIGGGDTVSAIKKLNLQSKFTHVSTGGGATLELLENGSLPAIDVLDDE